MWLSRSRENAKRTLSFFSCTCRMVKAFGPRTQKSDSEVNASRFVSPSKSLESYQRGFVPKNTEVNTQWAVRNFNNWSADYKSSPPEQPCPEGILLSDSSSELSFWLQKYVLGTRKKSGEKCPPKTVYLLLCGLDHL